MQKTWKGKNIDLASLATHICNFLKERDFEIVKGETPKGYEILAGDSPDFRLRGYVDVTIEGKPNNFNLEFSLCGRNNESRVSPFLLGMFGGGYFYLQELKSNEAWMKLKKEFWKYLDDVLLYLENSAEPSD